jgi:hypothetical protein
MPKITSPFDVWGLTAHDIAQVMAAKSHMATLPLDMEAKRALTDLHRAQVNLIPEKSQWEREKFTQQMEHKSAILDLKTNIAANTMALGQAKLEMQGAKNEAQAAAAQLKHDNLARQIEKDNNMLMDRERKFELSKTQAEHKREMDENKTTAIEQSLKRIYDQHGKGINGVIEGGKESLKKKATKPGADPSDVADWQEAQRLEGLAKMKTGGKLVKWPEYTSIPSVQSAFKAGKIPRELAKQILQEQFGVK